MSSPAGSPAFHGLIAALTRLLILCIEAYRVTLSPLLGGFCRFEPSCSRFAEEALRRHGPVRGMRLAIQRILKCQPFGSSGFDPVP